MTKDTTHDRRELSPVLVSVLVSTPTSPSTPVPTFVDHVLNDVSLGSVPFAQPFLDVQQFCAHYRLTLDRHTKWRLTPRIVGHVNGLPSSFGVLCATNGILCFIIQGDAGKHVFQGHMAWFVPADSSTDVFAQTGVMTQHQSRIACAKQAKREKALREYD